MDETKNDSNSAAATADRKPFTKQAAEKAGEKMAAGNTQKRESAGVFGGKQSMSLSEAKKMLGESFDKGSGKKLPAETDAKALDEVKAKGKDSDANSDRASKKDASTDKGEGDAASKKATGSVDPKKLERAQQALKLAGWTDEDFKSMSDERVVALGEKAHARDVEQGKKNRDKPTDTDADKADDASGDAGDKLDDAVDDDPDEDALVDAAVKTHFKGFEPEQVKPWAKALRSFVGAESKRVQTAANKHSEGLITKATKEITARAEKLIDAAMATAEFDRTAETLKVEGFSEIDTDEGRLELANAIGERRAGGNKMSVRALALQESRALWGDARQKRIEERKRQDELDSAKDNGTLGVVTRSIEGGRNKTGKELFAESFDRHAKR